MKRWGGEKNFGRACGGRTKGRPRWGWGQTMKDVFGFMEAAMRYATERGQFREAIRDATH